MSYCVTQKDALIKNIAVQSVFDLEGDLNSAISDKLSSSEIYDIVVKSQSLTIDVQGELICLIPYSKSIENSCAIELMESIYTYACVGFKQYDNLTS